MKRYACMILSLALILCAYTGCEKKETVINVGVAGPMTGPQAKMGTDFRNGVTIAVEEWNSRGGVLGKKIEMVVGDDQSDPKQAVAVANKLVNEGVAGVIGHFNSSCSIPASDVYNRAGIPMVSPGSTNPLLTERGYRAVFRVCGRDDQQGKVGARYVTDVLKLKRVAVVHDKTTYGQGLADEFKKNLGQGVDVVYYGSITQGEKDFKTVLTSVKEKKPELIYFGGYYPEAGLLVKQAREISMNVPFMSGDGAIDPKFIEIAGEKAAEGTFLTFGPDAKNFPEAKAFVEKYTARFGEIGPYSNYAYDAALVLFTAMREAQSTEGKALAEKIHSLEFSGSMGKIRFTDKGDVAVAPYVVWITRSGKFVEHWKP